MLRSYTNFLKSKKLLSFETFIKLRILSSLWYECFETRQIIRKPSCTLPVYIMQKKKKKKKKKKFQALIAGKIVGWQYKIVIMFKLQVF